MVLVLCGAVFGINIYNANANSLVGNKMPMPFGYGSAVVLTGSMEPTISAGDLIVVKEADSYQVDDIVVYQEGNILVVHRIIEIEGETVVTKGDANNVADHAIELSMIKGKLFFVIPSVGPVVDFIKSPIGTVLIIAVAIALVEIPRRREQQQDDEERQKIIDEIRRLKDLES